MNGLLNRLIAYYNATSFTHHYAFGFNYKGTVYACFCESNMLESICKLDKASSKNGGGYSLRFQLTMAIRDYMLNVCDSVALCSYDEFKARKASNKYNWGENFEMLMAEKYGCTWKKDNRKYTDYADMYIDNKPYQLKYYKASFITENQIKA